MQVQKLIPKDKGFSLGDVKAAIGSVNYILSNAARHTVGHKAVSALCRAGVTTLSDKPDSVQLNDELQQLGLPRENADGISRPYRSNAEALHTAASKRTLALPRLTSLQWRVDYVLAASAMKTAGVPVAHLQVHTSHSSDATQLKPSAAEMGVQVSLSANRAGAASADEKSDGSTPEQAALQARMDAACRALGVSAAPGHGSTLQLSLGREKLLALLSELRTARELLQQTRSTLSEH